jgi:ketosteroid isomerase-like protein
MRAHISIATAAAMLFLASAAFADDAETIESLKSDVITLDQAYADEDVATIESLLAPDFVGITARYGGPAEVEQQIAAFEDTQRKHLDHSPVEVVLLSPDIAFVTFQKTYEGTYKGKPLPPRVAVGAIWVKQDGKWLNRTYQETEIAPE